MASPSRVANNLATDRDGDTGRGVLGEGFIVSVRAQLWRGAAARRCGGGSRSLLCHAVVCEAREGVGEERGRVGLGVDFGYV